MAKNQTPQPPPTATPPPANFPDPIAWFERTRSLSIYSDALAEADRKVLNLFETFSQQTQKAFDHSMNVYIAASVVIVAALAISLYIAFFDPTGSDFSHTFSLVGVPVSGVALIILLIRNPLKQSREMMENTIRLNVIFLSFVRRLQQSDLMLRYTFMQDPKMTIDQIYTVFQDFQNIIDQTVDELTQSLRDLK